MDFDNGGVRSLMGAVCLQAVKDWRKCNNLLFSLRVKQIKKGPYNAIDKLAKNPLLYLSEADKKKKIKAERILSECEDFFDSPMFVEMTGLSGKDEAVSKLFSMNYRQREALKRSDKRS